MQGLYLRMAPFTPDSAGAATMFADCPAMVVPFDMNGTVSTFRNRVGVSDESPFRMASALGARETDYVMGNAAGYAAEALSLQRRFGGDTVVLMHGPVSAMAGIDLKTIAANIEQKSGLKALAVECTTGALHDEGLSRAVMAVYGRVKAALAAHPAPEEPCYADEGGVNVLGLNAIDCHDLAWRELMLGAAARATGEPILSVWGSKDSWRQWNRAYLARENIVVTASALKLAKAMQRDWGIPYRRIDEFELGLSPLPAAIRVSRVPKVLIVHEQLVANAARRLFEAAGFDVEVASFHKMDRAAKRSCDVQLNCEEDLVTLSSAKDYDVLVGDAALLNCVPRGKDIAFIEMEHSAVAPILSMDKGEPAPFSPEWVEKAGRALRDRALAS